MITEAEHKRNLARIPRTSKFKGTIAEALVFCRTPARNRSELEALLTKSLAHLRLRNFYLGVKLFTKRGKHRLLFIDPSNNMVLWFNVETHKLNWWPLYGDGSYPSIL